MDIVDCAIFVLSLKLCTDMIKTVGIFVQAQPTVNTFSKKFSIFSAAIHNVVNFFFSILLLSVWYLIPLDFLLPLWIYYLRLLYWIIFISLGLICCWCSDSVLVPSCLLILSCLYLTNITDAYWFSYHQCELHISYASQSFCII